MSYLKDSVKWLKEKIKASDGPFTSSGKYLSYRELHTFEMGLVLATLGTFVLFEFWIVYLFGVLVMFGIEQAPDKITTHLRFEAWYYLMASMPPLALEAVVYAVF